MGCTAERWVNILPLKSLTSVKPKLGSGYRGTGDYLRWHKDEGYELWALMQVPLAKYAFSELAKRKQDIAANALYMWDNPRFSNTQENRHMYVFFKTEADWLFFYMYAMTAPEECRERNGFRAIYQYFNHYKVRDIA